MHIIRVLLTAAWFMLAATGHAFAGPVLAGVMAFAMTPIGGILVNLAVGAAMNFVGGLLTRATAPEEKQAGFRLQVQVGDTSPFAFPVGRTAIAGTRKYIGTWGQDGDTPNAYLTDVIQISDIPVSGLDGFWAMKQRCTVAWDEFNDIGAPVTEFRVEGKDHMWVRFYDGRQSEADQLLASKFSGGERPWTGNMIGRHCAYVVVTTLVNRELFSSAPDFLFEPAAPVLYDLRKDSTNGGNGPHRWNDPSTFETSTNPAVIIYNIIRGIYRGGEWHYGGQNLPAFRLPPSSWMAAANECDALVPRADGGTERQFRCGTEVRGDIEPLALIKSLLQGCSGRLAEVGGKFEILIGAPGAAVFAFTDDDIVITRGQSFTPFPSLQETHNGIEATYPEPEEMWATKDAPARYSSDFEAQDGNRRLATGIDFPTVPFPVQVQRLMKAMLEEERRFRIHSITLGPEAWALTPNSVVAWSSARNGYTNKKFLVVRIVGEPGMLQQVLLKEIDPTDYSWSSDDELPAITGPLGPQPPPAQEVKGFWVEPIVGRDNAGNARRPGIRVHWNGEQPDVRTIKISIRLDEGDIPVWEGRPVKFADGVADILGDPILPRTTYEVEGEYEPFGARPTVPTGWYRVTTPDIGISLYDVDEEFRNVVGIISGMGQGSLSERLGELYDRLAQLAATEVSATVQAYTERRELEATQNEDRAYFLEQVTVLVDADKALATMITVLEAEFNDNVAFVGQQLTALSNADSALAELIEQVEVEVDGVTAGGIFKMEASAGPFGWSTKISAIVRANANGTFYEAGWYTLVNSNGNNVFAVKANDFYFLNDAGGVITSPFYISGGTVYIKTAVIQDLTLGTEKLANFAASRLQAANSSGTITVSGGDEAQLQSLNVNPAGNSLVITAGCHTESSGTGTARGELQIRKNGVAVMTNDFATDDVPTTFNQLVYVEQNPSPATYTLQLVVSSGGIGTGGGIRTRRRFILAHNGKR
jgi:hypothetical protein